MAYAVKVKIFKVDNQMEAIKSQSREYVSAKLRYSMTWG
jgi:hypothetical protein